MPQNYLAVAVQEEVEVAYVSSTMSPGSFVTWTP
jgi:hypothetical protein